ncbi:MAG: hypothetical protein ACOC33_00705 [bacterium]
MKINLNDLPKEIYNNLPLSIKITKNEYDLKELPNNIQHKISKVLNKKKEIEYFHGFDFLPKISKYNDLESIENIKNLVLDRLQNYFLTLPNEYPFNCVVGCRLKYHLQTKDTQTRNLLLDSELTTIVSTIKSDLSIHNLSIQDFKIDKKEFGGKIEYNVFVIIKLNDEVFNLKFSI